MVLCRSNFRHQIYQFFFRRVHLPTYILPGGNKKTAGDENNHSGLGEISFFMMMMMGEMGFLMMMIISMAKLY